MVVPQRWALRLAITGELRYLSHLDCVRVIERAAARAAVPVRFSQGFNPHPVMSLAMARPVGVAALQELIVLAFDETLDGEQLMAKLNSCAPEGISFSEPKELDSRRTPRPVRMSFEADIDEDRRAAVAAGVASLLESEVWPVERVKAPRDRRRKPRQKSFDAKKLVSELSVDASTSILRWRCVPEGDLWPRVSEVLSLVGLTARSDIARVRRTAVEYDW